MIAILLWLCTFVGQAHAATAMTQLVPNGDAATTGTPIQVGACGGAGMWRCSDESVLAAPDDSTAVSALSTWSVRFDMVDAAAAGVTGTTTGLRARVRARCTAAGSSTVTVQVFNGATAISGAWPCQCRGRRSSTSNPRSRSMRTTSSIPPGSTRCGCS